MTANPMPARPLLLPTDPSDGQQQQKQRNQQLLDQKTERLFGYSLSMPNPKLAQNVWSPARKTSPLYNQQHKNMMDKLLADNPLIEQLRMSSDPSTKKFKSEHEKDGEEEAAKEKHTHEDVKGLEETRPLAASSPVHVNRQNRRYTIRPEEYSVIEEFDSHDNGSDVHSWNPNEAFNESIQLDESVDQLSTSSSSSSSSGELSYSLELARQLIASYPTVDEMVRIIEEDYVNYITELSQSSSPSSCTQGRHQLPEQASPQVISGMALSDDSAILSESTDDVRANISSGEHHNEPNDHRGEC